MRMSLMFAAVTLLTGINLFFIPFQPVPALWGAILAVAFVLINVVADKLRLWSGIVLGDNYPVRIATITLACL